MPRPGPACYGRGGERPAVTDADVRAMAGSDTRVVASSPAFAAGKTATVKTLFGPLNSTISAAVKKVQ